MPPAVGARTPALVALGLSFSALVLGWVGPAWAGDPAVQQRRVWFESRSHEGVAYAIVRVKRFTHVRPLVPRKAEDVLGALTRPHAIAAINGGFFDAKTGQPWGFASIRQGGYPGRMHHLADPTLAAGLRNHPLVGPRLPQYLAERVEWREVNGCGLNWAIQPHRGWSLDPNEANAALQAGPRLLPKLTLREEGFAFPGGEDLVASRDKLPRSALGLTEAGDMLWVVAKAPGVSLPGLALALKRFGAIEAMALDGGAEASLAYRLPGAGPVALSGDGGATKPVASLLVAYDRSPNE